jgi:hypothetical protein
VAIPPHWRTVLRELREEIAAHLEPGAPGMRCRVCRRRVFKYRRKLNSGMARSIIAAFVYDRDRAHGKYFHFRMAGLQQNQEYAKLEYWGLLERKFKGVTEVRGWWRVTERGREFVREKIRVPRWAYCYNDHCYGLSEEETSIRQALGDKFDLDELLSDNRAR